MQVRAVVDASVLVRAGLSKQLASAAQSVFHSFFAGHFEFLYNRDIVREWSSVAVGHRLPRRIFHEFMTHVVLLGFPVPDRPVPYYGCVDRTDEVYLDCAVQGHATHLVTLDIHLLDLHQDARFNFKICGPPEFLHALRHQVP